MKKKYSIDVNKGKEMFIVRVYRWILFGLIPICVKTYFGYDLDIILFEANDYITWHNR